MKIRLLLCSFFLSAAALAAGPRQPVTLHDVAAAPAAGFHAADGWEPGPRAAFYLSDETLLDGDDLDSVSVSRDAASQLGLVLSLSADGARKLAAATRVRQGQTIAIVVAGKVVSAPVVRAELGSRSLQLALPDAAAADIVTALGLPLPAAR